jgi:hypothetical protein
MMCLGWVKNNNCGRKEQVIPPCNVCPDISWFYIGAVAAMALAVMGKKGASA